MKLAFGVLLACSLYGYQEQKGSLEGRVVNSVTGDPLRRATLTLTKTGGKGEPVTAQPDDNGRFIFREVEAGDYRLAGERAGYQKQNYGARAGAAAGLVLRVKAGEAVKDIVFKMVPNTVISGRVSDDAGEPMPSLLVSAYRQSYASGKKTWQQESSAQTNDRGEYRIANLKAGRYLISATDLRIGIGLAGVSSDAQTDKADAGYSSTWFGNTVDIAQASAIDVGAGEDRRGADIRMLRTPTFRVRGKISAFPDGKILVVAAMRKRSAQAGQTPGGIGLVQQGDGTFEIKGLSPGSYMVLSRSATEINSAASSAAIVEIVDHNVEGLELKAGGAGTVSGTLAIAGGAPAGLKEMTLRLEMLDYPLPDNPNGKPGDDGKFSLTGILDGRYRVRVSGLPDEAYLKSARFNGQPIDIDSAEISAGGTLEVLASHTAAKVDGSAIGTDDKPINGAVIALIPESGRESLYQDTTSGFDGKFTLKHIAPGKYKLLAWESIEPGAFQDPEFVKSFEAKAEVLSLDENVRQTVTLKVIPSGAQKAGER